MIKKVVVNHDNRSVFIPIGKCGTQTIKSLLQPFGYRSEKYFEGLEDYFIFTTLRNPYERFISAFIEASMATFKKRWNKGYLFTNKEHWEKFVKSIELCEQNDFWNIHLKPQIYFLTRKKSMINIDLYMIIEKLDRDIKKLNSNLNLNLKSTYGHICSYIDLKRFLKIGLAKHKRLINKINKIYQKDWELYKKYI